MILLTSACELLEISQIFLTLCECVLNVWVVIFCKCAAVSYIMCPPMNVCHCKSSMTCNDTAVVPKHILMFFPHCLSEVQRAWESPLLTRAITFLFTTDGRSLTSVFSERHSLMVSDEKQARCCDPRVNCYERLDLFWCCLPVFGKTSCWDSCFPKGHSGIERSDGNCREWPTVVSTERLADRYILWVIRYES